MQIQIEEMPGGFLSEINYKKQKESDNVVEDDDVNEGVNEGVSLLLQQIMKTPGYRVPYYANKLNISSKTIERWMSQLRKEGKVEFIGASKTGGYFFKRNKL